MILADEYRRRLADFRHLADGLVSALDARLSPESAGTTGCGSCGGDCQPDRRAVLVDFDGEVAALGVEDSPDVPESEPGAVGQLVDLRLPLEYRPFRLG